MAARTQLNLDLLTPRIVTPARCGDQLWLLGLFLCHLPGDSCQNAAQGVCVALMSHSEQLQSQVVDSRVSLLKQFDGYVGERFMYFNKV